MYRFYRNQENLLRKKTSIIFIEVFSFNMELIKLVSISLCMIVKNEENTLGRCLETIKDLVEEMIIVDTGSTDKTKEVAMQFTDNIFDFAWIDDFAAARNYSFQFASKEYIMWLDADDILDEKKQTAF